MTQLVPHWTRQDEENLARRVRNAAHPPAPRVIHQPSLPREADTRPHDRSHRVRVFGGYRICMELTCPKLVV